MRQLRSSSRRKAPLRSAALTALMGLMLMVAIGSFSPPTFLAGSMPRRAPQFLLSAATAWLVACSPAQAWNIVPKDEAKEPVVVEKPIPKPGDPDFVGIKAGIEKQAFETRREEVRENNAKAVAGNPPMPSVENKVVIKKKVDVQPTAQEEESGYVAVPMLDGSIYKAPLSGLMIRPEQYGGLGGKDYMVHDRDGKKVLINPDWYGPKMPGGLFVQPLSTTEPHNPPYGVYIVLIGIGLAHGLTHPSQYPDLEDYVENAKALAKAEGKVPWETIKSPDFD